MKLWFDWGFTATSWRGERGEYWVLGQAILLLAFAVLPVYYPPGWGRPQGAWLSLLWAIAATLGLGAIVLLGSALYYLGQSLTPLPYPRSNGNLVQSGPYRYVRHPIYSGLIFATLAWALYQVSCSHLLGNLVLATFLNAKASREEVWLSEKYPEYSDYRHRVKKLIPWVY